MVSSLFFFLIGIDLNLVFGRSARMGRACFCFLNRACASSYNPFFFFTCSHKLYFLVFLTRITILSLLIINLLDTYILKKKAKRILLLHVCVCMCVWKEQWRKSWSSPERERTTHLGIVHVRLYICCLYLLCVLCFFC